MNYEEMSDFEINRKVASYAAESGWLAGVKSPRSDSELILKYQNGPGCTRNKYMDYCNNPSDAWPIIVKNRISILGDSGSGNDDEWMACQGFWVPGEFDCHNCVTYPNPLRAAMIVFLMMKDAECQKY